MWNPSCKNKDSAFLFFLIISPDKYSLFMKQLENLVFVEIPRFLFFFFLSELRYISELRREKTRCVRPGPEVIKLFSCSTQLSRKFFLLINVKMPTIVGILTFISRKNGILGLSESEKSFIS